MFSIPKMEQEQTSWDRFKCKSSGRRIPRFSGADIRVLDLPAPQHERSPGLQRNHWGGCRPPPPRPVLGDWTWICPFPAQRVTETNTTGIFHNTSLCSKHVTSQKKSSPSLPIPAAPAAPPHRHLPPSLPPSLRPPARRSASPDSGGGARGRGSPRPLPGGGDCGPRRRRRLCLPETGAHPGTPRPPSEREARPRPGGAGCPRRQTESGSAGHPPSAPGGASPAAGRPPGAGARPGQVPGGRRAPPPPRALASPGSMGALRPAAARGEARPWHSPVVWMRLQSAHARFRQPAFPATFP